MNERLYIDLATTQIFGWEEAKSADVVASIVRGYDMGDDIPPIRVAKIDDTTYEIAQKERFTLQEEHWGGGHTRTLATMQRGSILDAIVVAKSDTLRSDAINIKDVQLVPDSHIGKNDLYRKPDGTLLWISTLRTKKSMDTKYR
jgi:hypothetical protein